MTEAKLDKAFSLFIRERDTNADGYGACWTCGKLIHIKDGHCGHFISRRHKATRWNEQNTGLQCYYCNMRDQGRQFQFSIEINKKYGAGTSDKLLALSRGTCKYGKFEYEQLAKHYTEETKKLKKLKS